MNRVMLLIMAIAVAAFAACAPSATPPYGGATPTPTVAPTPTTAAPTATPTPLAGVPGGVVPWEDALRMAVQVASRPSMRGSAVENPHNLQARLMAFGTYLEEYDKGEWVGIDPSLLVWAVQMQGGSHLTVGPSEFGYAAVLLDARTGETMSVAGRYEPVFPLPDQGSRFRLPPRFPVGLIAHAVQGEARAVELSWVDLATDETAYVVERSSAGESGPWEIAAVLPSDTMTYLDHAPSTPGVYTYRVKTRNANGDSPTSNTEAVAFGDVGALPPTPTPTVTPTPVEPAVREVLEKMAHPGGISEVVPGFGGYYVEGGIVYVYMKDLTRQEAAEEAARILMGDRPISEVRVLPARYTISQLGAWYSRMHNLVGFIGGLCSTDLDEAHNALTYGFEDRPGVQRDVDALIAALGIPQDAVSIEIGGCARLL